MGPQSFNAIFSARSGDTLRRNAMLLPFYQCFLSLMLFAGLVGRLDRSGIERALPSINHSCWSLRTTIRRGCWGWSARPARSPRSFRASALLLGGASVITKNVAGDAFGIATSDKARTMLTRVLVLVVAVLALGVWLVAGKTVVELLLLYYNGITQFAPGVIATFVWPRVTAWGVGAGIAVGLAVAIPLAALNISAAGASTPVSSVSSPTWW